MVHYANGRVPRRVMCRRPCCTGVKGKCQLNTESECEFLGGHYHGDKLLCSEVACMVETCTTYWGATPVAKKFPLESDIENPNQWYRSLLPVFLHAGIIHFIIAAVPLYYFMKPIEIAAGWIRVLLIFCFATIGGYTTSGIFDPYGIAVGSNAAFFGYLSVNIVELFMTWALLDDGWFQMFKMLIWVTFAFILGTLPYLVRMWLCCVYHERPVREGQRGGLSLIHI